MNVFTDHIGYLCDQNKSFVADDGPYTEFEIQDMSRVNKETLGEFEDWVTVYTGKLEKSITEMGTFLTGDFSSITTPGIYRVVLDRERAYSFQFTISDGIHYPLIRSFLDFTHNWRSGDFSNAWRGPSHLDDAIRSDTREYRDVSGGWYDAGDTRKWMTMSNLPVIGFLDIAGRLGISWNHFTPENISGNDLITEAAWGLDFILKMQDPETGMIFEEVGAGGEARKKPGMTWWYENHSGCLADNSENHFTDNKINSGDERTIRTDYNPIVQYTSIYILLRAFRGIKDADKELADRCLESGRRVWEFTHPKKSEDPLHDWTSVKAWRLYAGIELFRNEIISGITLGEMVDDLVANWEKKLAFWHMDSKKEDPYRGILHSAQPLIALSALVESFPEHNKADTARSIIHNTWAGYILPMLHTNPFGIMPYGTFFNKKTTKDTYRLLRDKLFFRYYMPDNSQQKINHGLGGHWTSWAHALALAGKIMKNKAMTTAAWDQLNWLWGKNPLNVCMVSGFGYNNPMPHSRFLGRFPGGFCVGPRGDLKDEIVIDRQGRADWSSTEYWLTPLSNALMALAILLPEKTEDRYKLGYRSAE